MLELSLSNKTSRTSVLHYWILWENSQKYAIFSYILFFMIRWLSASEWKIPFFRVDDARYRQERGKMSASYNNLFNSNNEWFLLVMSKIYKVNTDQFLDILTVLFSLTREIKRFMSVGISILGGFKSWWKMGKFFHWFIEKSLKEKKCRSDDLRDVVRYKKNYSYHEVYSEFWSWSNLWKAFKSKSIRLNP